MVILNKEGYEEKIAKFLQENQFVRHNKDTTTKFQKQITQTISQCKTLKLKQQHLTQIQPKAPKLNVRIKVHKAGTLSTTDTDLSIK
jgi:hypothetical protein